jgi:hypothetical protein
MTNIWGFKAQPEFSNRCSRCAQVECICGDAAFEKWVDAQLMLERMEDLDSIMPPSDED